MEQPRVSLRDIAVKAGVTTATVSLALRNSPEVSEKRRVEIKKLARQLKYRPDPALSALAEYRRQRRQPKYHEHLAFIYQTQEMQPLDEWSDWPIRRGMLIGMKERAHDIGYGLEIHDMGVTDAKQKQLARMLRARGIRGLIIHANLQSPESVFCHFHAFATLNLLQFVEHPTFHSIDSHGFFAMHQALEKCYALGYRNPLYVTGEIRYGYLGPEKEGALAQFQKSHPDTCCRCLCITELTANPKEILSTVPEVDVILTHDFREIGKLSERIGLRIPQDVGLCFLFTSAEMPQYAGIDVQAKVIGRRSIETTDLMLRHNEIGVTETPNTLLVHPIWQDGPSLPPKRPAKA